MTVGLLKKLRLQIKAARCSLINRSVQAGTHFSMFVSKKVSILEGYHQWDIQYPLEKFGIAAILRYH